MFPILIITNFQYIFLSMLDLLVLFYLIQFYKQWLWLQIISHSIYIYIYKMIKRILLFLGVLYHVSADDLYSKVLNTIDPNAVCLDGSPPFLYIHRGQDTTRFLIYFMEGGICQGYTLQQTLNNCIERSMTTAGSSNGWPNYYQGQGILSTNPLVNDMANWTKIIIGSCDSSFHQGYRNMPITYKGQKIYFRGSANTRAHLRWINQTFPYFRQALQIVVAGSSTGGIASFLWANYIKGLVLTTTPFYLIPDSSILWATKTYLSNLDYVLTMFTNIYKLANSDEKTPWDACNVKYPDQEYNCFFFSSNVAIQNTQIKSLFINSEYDSWAIQKALQIKCLTNGATQYSLAACNSQQMQFIEQYRNTTKFLITYFQVSVNHNAWTIGCSQHRYINVDRYYDSPTERVPAMSGPTIKQAIRNFVFLNQRVRVNDTAAWPGNYGCAR